MPGNSRSIDRRAFNRRAFVSVIGAGTVAAATPLGVSEALAYDPGAQETRQRYQETEHVKAFYRTNGYETLKK